MLLTHDLDFGAILAASGDLKPSVLQLRSQDVTPELMAGKIADLVVLARNPLVDIANTRTVAAVVADGRYYSSRELDRMRLRIMELAGK